MLTAVESFENSMVNCSNELSIEFTSTDVFNTSNFVSGCEIAKNTSLSELNTTVQLFSLGIVYRAYFQAFSSSPLNRISDEASNVVAAFAPVLQ